MGSIYSPLESALACDYFDQQSVVRVTVCHFQALPLSVCAALSLVSWSPARERTLQGEGEGDGPSSAQLALPWCQAGK